MMEYSVPVVLLLDHQLCVTGIAIVGKSKIDLILVHFLLVFH